MDKFSIPMTSNNEMHEVLYDGIYGMLSTSDNYNRPYGVPMNYIYSGCNIYFYSSRHGKKINNMDHNKNVSFGVVDTMDKGIVNKYKSVIVYGQIVEVHGAERRSALLQLIEKYGDEYINDDHVDDKSKEWLMVLRINISEMTGRKSL